MTSDTGFKSLLKINITVFEKLRHCIIVHQVWSTSSSHTGKYSMQVIKPCFPNSLSWTHLNVIVMILIMSNRSFKDYFQHDSHHVQSGIYTSQGQKLVHHHCYHLIDEGVHQQALWQEQELHRSTSQESWDMEVKCCAIYVKGQERFYAETKYAHKDQDAKSWDLQVNAVQILQSRPLTSWDWRNYMLSIKTTESMIRFFGLATQQLKSKIKPFLKVQLLQLLQAAMLETHLLLTKRRTWNMETTILYPHKQAGLSVKKGGSCTIQDRSKSFQECSSAFHGRISSAWDTVPNLYSFEICFEYNKKGHLPKLECNHNISLSWNPHLLEQLCTVTCMSRT